MPGGLGKLKTLDHRCAFGMDTGCEQQASLIDWPCPRLSQGGNGVESELGPATGPFGGVQVPHSQNNQKELCGEEEAPRTGEGGGAGHSRTGLLGVPLRISAPQARFF